MIVLPTNSDRHYLIFSSLKSYQNLRMIILKEILPEQYLHFLVVLQFALKTKET